MFMEIRKLTPLAKLSMPTELTNSKRIFSLVKITKTKYLFFITFLTQKQKHYDLHFLYLIVI